jgi:hypothetical protein
MDYTPKANNQQAPPTTYELTKDVTGKPPEKRGEVIITDKTGTPVKLPYPPKQNCKKCYGRGYVGTNVVTGRFLICLKCYPMARARA